MTNDPAFFQPKDNLKDLKFEPTYITVPAVASSLKQAYEILVTDLNTTETCTMQFRFHGKCSVCCWSM